jgi:hypothetical protein
MEETIMACDCARIARSWLWLREVRVDVRDTHSPICWQQLHLKEYRDLRDRELQMDRPRGVRGEMASPSLTHALALLALLQQVLILYLSVALHTKLAVAPVAPTNVHPAAAPVAPGALSQTRRPNRRSPYFLQRVYDDRTPHNAYRTRYLWAAERAWRLLAHELQAELVDVGARPRGRNVIRTPVAFFINLDRRTERRRAFEERYRAAAVSDILPLIRFPAVDGRSVRRARQSHRLRAI